MSPVAPYRKLSTSAFSLIELLIVVTIIGILAAIVIASFSNATQDSRNVIVLQQQAVVQGALNSWIAHASSGQSSLSSARTLYNAASGGSGKLALIAPYLDSTTVSQFSAHGAVANALQSDAMERTDHYITFSAWNAGSYPKVILGP
jgi:prepilin-type N-terminal cleavage/methylation domain-containing protein